ncbi:hypothetical protein PIB30_018454 [Stylosanthes scabra]|uniref:Uncharacterized protein n=1 Tax=Stylosanthes scabra TaxID=79078 RepID=A0ABU6UAM3_9FABA|nr:hypothetical protein [Stylosanthes scabra]
MGAYLITLISDNHLKVKQRRVETRPKRQQALGTLSDDSGGGYGSGNDGRTKQFRHRWRRDLQQLDSLATTMEKLSRGGGLNGDRGSCSSLLSPRRRYGDGTATTHDGNERRLGGDCRSGWQRWLPSERRRRDGDRQRNFFLPPSLNPVFLSPSLL